MLVKEVGGLKGEEGEAGTPLLTMNLFVAVLYDNMQL